eukprot:COSAG01_NODE_69261_length_262_cov_0.282209_1_plen_62_part_10
MRQQQRGGGGGGGGAGGGGGLGGGGGFATGVHGKGRGRPVTFCWIGVGMFFNDAATTAIYT